MGMMKKILGTTVVLGAAGAALAYFGNKDKKEKLVYSSSRGNCYADPTRVPAAVKPIVPAEKPAEAKAPTKETAEAVTTPAEEQDTTAEEKAEQVVENSTEEKDAAEKQ